ncbi:MAG: hypothetical protein RL291_1977, partial [Pseudomonadota bacterium]
KQVDHLKLEVSSASDSPRGHVSVGLPTTMAMHLTVPLVQSVLRKYPGVTLHVIEGMSGHIQEWVQAGRIDIALLYTSDPVPGLDLTVLLTEDLYLIASNKTHRDAPSAVKLAELASLPLVLPGLDHGLRRNIERVALDAKVTLNVPVEVDSLTHMKRLVLDGALFTILPWAACRDEIRDATLVARRIVDPVMRRPVVVAVGQDRPLSLACRSVLQLTSSLVSKTLGAPQP